MSYTSDEEVIPPSPSSAIAVRSQKRLIGRFSRRHSHVSQIATILKNAESSVNDIMSQREETENQVIEDPLVDREVLPGPSQAPDMHKEGFNENILDSIYDSPEQKDTPEALEDISAWMELPETAIGPPEMLKASAEASLPDFVALSQIASSQGVAEELGTGSRSNAGDTQLRFEEYLNEDVDVFLEVPSQAPDWQKFSSPVRKRLKIDNSAANSPDVLHMETENLLESSDEDIPNIFNKTVVMPGDEEEEKDDGNFGVSPVIKGNIDVLSKSFDGEESSQKSSSEGKLSLLQKKQHFVDVQLVRRSFFDVSQPTKSQEKPKIKEITDIVSSPTCSKKAAAPKRLFREAFKPHEEDATNEPQSPLREDPQPGFAISGILPMNPQPFGGFMMANMKKVTISEETMKRVQHVFADLGGCAPLGDAPGFQTVTFRKECPKPAVPKLKEEAQMEEEGKPPVEQKRDPDSEQGYFCSSMFEDMFTQNVLEAIEKPEKETSAPSQVFTVTDDVRLGREAATKHQEEVIAQKPKTYSKAFKSEMIEKKLAPRKKTLKDFVSKQLPRKYTEMELRDHGVNVAAIGLCWEKSLEIEFDLSEHWQEKEVQIEHFAIVPDLRNKIGFRGLSRAFLASKGINPHIIPEGWLENSWKFVVSKLAAMEISFPGYFAGEALTPRNVLHQLHYRYHREFNLGDKPCLRKITELEEAAQKTLVLYVLDIRSEDFVILSDGWYKIPGKFDRALEDKVKRGKIIRGTKLIAQGCKLLNCDSEYSPLDLPPNVFLELHGNATRRCRWDTKLGFYPQSQPHCVNLDSVMYNGGLIPQIRVRIIRVYPAVFTEVSRERRKPIVRSERAEKRYCARLSRCFDNFENIYNEVQEEFAKRQSQHSISIRNITNISSIRDPEQLNNLLNYSYDPESVENGMTGTQKDMVRQHLAKIQEKRYQEIADCVRKRLRQQRVVRKVQRLLQIRAVDAKRPAGNFVINFWTPLEEITTLFREGDVYEFTSCNAREIRNGDVYIDGPSVEEEDGNIRKLDGSLFPPAPQYDRHITSFPELPTRERPDFTEFDVVGVVVEIQCMQDNRKFEQVLLADPQKNIIRLTFWKGLANFALEDVVTLGAVLCFSNLQWRPSSTQPQLAASETTVVTMNPKNLAHQKALEDVRQLVSSRQSIQDFLEECKQNIQ